MLRPTTGVAVGVAPRSAGESESRIDSATGDAPEWTFYVQVMPFAEAADYRFNPFDLTKVWPKGG
jgi:hypothetical protein